MSNYFKSLIARILENELIQRIVKNAGYLFSATGISAAISFFQGILATRILGVATFGVLGGLTTFTSTVNRFASFRMNELVVKYVGQYTEKQDSSRAAALFKSAALLEITGSLVAFSLVWVLAPFGAEYFAHDPSLTPLFRMYGSTILANLIFESATGLLQIFDQYRNMAVVQVGQSILTFVLILIAYFTNQGLTAVVVAYMSGKIAGAVGFTGLAVVQARNVWGKDWWKEPISQLRKQRRSILTFAFSTNISSTISLIAKDSEVLWVSAFLGTTQAGYYKLALALSNMLQLPVSPLPKATYPELTREIARKSWSSVRYILKQGSRIAAMYSLPATIGLILIGRPLIEFVYKPEFLPAYPALVILLTGFTFVNIFYWNRVALLSLARPIYPTIVNFWGMLLKVGAIFIFVPRFGYLAFPVLLVGYYLFTVGLAAIRVFNDLRMRSEAGEPV